MVPVQHCREDFYPRSPCGERLGILGRRLRYREQFLSTLSLRRATSQCRTLASGMYDFYPRSPCGERRQGADPCGQKRGISIHALLAESDARIIDPTFGQEVFLSTLSLRRATLKNAITAAPQQEFLSTLSLRRATAKVHKTVGHFCAYETNFMGIASSC